MACGQRLLDQQGIRVFQSNLASGFWRGLTPQDLAANLNRFQPGWKGGFVPELTAQQLTDLAGQGPFIARLGPQAGHFVVVDAIENGIVKLWDPAGGLAKTVPLGEFRPVVTGLVWRQ
jgi:hypothetical protein